MTVRIVGVVTLDWCVTRLERHCDALTAFRGPPCLAASHEKPERGMMRP